MISFAYDSIFIEVLYLLDNNPPSYKGFYTLSEFKVIVPYNSTPYTQSIGKDICAEFNKLKDKKFNATLKITTSYGPTDWDEDYFPDEIESAVFDILKNVKNEDINILFKSSTKSMSSMKILLDKIDGYFKVF